MDLLGLAAGLASAVVFGLAAVGQARGVRSFAVTPDDLVTFVRLSVRDPTSWLVLTAYAVGFVLHAVAIQLLPLYLAQVTVAFSLPVTALAAGLLDGRLAARTWVAVGLLSAGMALVAAGAGEAGEVVTSTAFTTWLLLGVLGLAGVTGLLRRRGGAVLGLLAGLGYAGTAVAVRGVEAPVVTAVVLAAAAVPVLGLLAFWAYSLGMRSARIATATGPMIAVQTLLPAVLGLAFLGDTVRAGWWPVLVVGLTLATGAATWLGRAEDQGVSEVAARG